MSELYLIAHKVRGEPAFDVAQKLQIGNEEGWIIPTSGHRAYPYWSISFAEMETCQSGCVFVTLGEMPPDLPDHYETHAKPGTGITNLFERLNLPRAQTPTITRRL